MKFFEKFSPGAYNGLIKFFYKAFLWGLGLFAVFIIALNFNLFWLFGKMPSVDDLDNPKSEVASEIISSDNKILGKFFFENRSTMTYGEIPENFKDALMATEDVRFAMHSGIDARSLFRVLGGVLTFNRKGGGSTVSQQLAKNLFKLRRDEAYEGFLYRVPGVRVVLIKLKEWITAIKLERRYTKSEIMTMYLNTIEFSSGAYGLKSAAKTYFSKDPLKLTTEEAALLVGMIQNPSRFNPKFFPKNSLERRNIVLTQMVKYNKITPEEGKELAQIPINLEYSPESHNYGIARYFREYLRDVVKGELKKLGYEENDIYTKGLKIYTTIDSRMQRYAEESVLAHMKDLQQIFDNQFKGRNPWLQLKKGSSSQYEELPGFIESAAKRSGHYQALRRKLGNDEAAIMKEMNEKKPMRVFTWAGERDTLFSHMDSLRHYKRFLNIGMMAMDPRNGNIKAWVGGINYKFFKYDNVFQSKRQPGSTFKPFVYVTAIDNGYSTCDRIVDEVVTYPIPGSKSWTPQNADRKSSGAKITLRQALGKSVNTISAKLIMDFGADEVVKYARNLGIKSELTHSPSLSLGVSDVTLFELLGGYATFVNQGVYTDPMVLVRIEDKNGEVLQDYYPIQKEVLSKETAFKMVHLLRGATVPGGTSFGGLSRFGLIEGNEVAAKTGTTSNFSDGWFMGMTQDLIGGVWVGGEDRAIHFESILYGQGARMALPAWGGFMKKVYEDPNIEYKKTKFIVPATIKVNGDCAISSGESYPVDHEGSENAVRGELKPQDDDELL